MQFWKLVLIVIAIGIFFMALGAWFGYRYISEQDEIRPTVGVESSNTGYTLTILPSNPHALACGM